MLGVIDMRQNFTDFQIYAINFSLAFHGPLETSPQTPKGFTDDKLKNHASDFYLLSA